MALFRGDSMLTTLQFALILTVAAIPVAMPTVLSVTMAVGARLLARKQAIVSRLASIEELAGMDVLCSDKTGTLTQNRLTLGEPFTAPGVSAAEVLAGRGARVARRGRGPDRRRRARRRRRAGAEGEVLHFMPFDPVQQAHRGDGAARGRERRQGVEGRAAGDPRARRGRRRARAGA